MSLGTKTKDPSDVLDYTVNWASFLRGDNISNSVWVVPSGITKVGESNSTTACSIVLSGGTASQTYTITNRITTVGGKTVERSFNISISDL